MKGLKFLIALPVTAHLLSGSALAQSSEMAGRDNFQAQQRALIVRIEQQESRLIALEKEIGLLRAQLTRQAQSQAQAQAHVPTPPATTPMPPASPVVAPIASGIQTYTVRSGDNLVAIARSNGISVAELMSANNLRSDRIQVGQILHIPVRTAAAPVPGPAPAPAPAPAPTPAPAPAPATSASTYTIASGDTIARVARKHGVSIESIIAANNLRNPDRIAIGQQIIIPSQAPAAAPVSPVVATPTVIAPPLNRAETPAPAAPVTPPAPEPAPEPAPAPVAEKAPEPTPDNPFPTGYAYYTVVSGDSLYSIGKLFGTTQKELEELNGLSAGAMIHPDQQIIVPVSNYKGPYVSN